MQAKNDWTEIFKNLELNTLDISSDISGEDSSIHWDISYNMYWAYTRVLKSIPEKFFLNMWSDFCNECYDLNLIVMPYEEDYFSEFLAFLWLKSKGKDFYLDTTKKEHREIVSDINNYYKENYETIQYQN